MSGKINCHALISIRVCGTSFLFLLYSRRDSNKQASQLGDHQIPLIPEISIFFLRRQHMLLKIRNIC